MCCRARGESGLFDPMNRIQRHGLAWAIEDRRLVHVIPESCNSLFHKVAVQAPPPLASLGPREIREHGRTRPDNSHELTAVGILHKLIGSVTGVVGRVSLVGSVCDVQVGDVDKMEVLFAQIGNKSGKVGEGRGVNGEWTVAILIVDVEINDVGRNSVRTKTGSNVSHLRLRRVRVTRLLEAERPKRRQRRLASEIRVAFHDLLRRWAINEVVVERSSFGAERDGITKLLAE